MIFLGDIALPNGIYPLVYDRNQFCDSVIANLEGGLPDKTFSPGKKLKLFNSESVLDYLHHLNIKVVSLANNHIFDINESPASTINKLKDSDIQFCGAGENLTEASKPAILNIAGKDIIFLAFGWEVIQCPSAGSNKAGVNPLRHEHIFSSIKAARSQYPNGIIILLMHWDYELELYPQPMHRQIAFDAIDYGANAIIGCHSHCVQGIEIYKEAPIVYGLGNWFIPQGDFFGRPLKFPDIVKKQLAFQWLPETSQMLCHWFEYEKDLHNIVYSYSEKLGDSTTIKELTPYSGMSHEEYKKWFRKNRRKKLLLPIYKNYDAQITNWLKDRWVGIRQALIGAAFLARIKQGPR